MVNGQKNYYSHWERLEPRSSVYGIVWQEYLAYAYIYTSNRKAKKMVERIKGYDKKTNCLIEEVGRREINMSIYNINTDDSGNFPPPDFILDGKGNIIEVRDRVTGKPLKVIKKVYKMFGGFKNGL